MRQENSCDNNNPCTENEISNRRSTDENTTESFGNENTTESFGNENYNPDRNTYTRTSRDIRAIMESAGIPSFREMQKFLLDTLISVRQPIVDYQEARGIPRHEKITFMNLMTSLCTHTYTAAITILVMLWNLAPLLDGFVYFARFVLDKLIDLLETDDPKEKALKSAIFTGEIIVICFAMFMIVGLIFIPVYVLMVKIVTKLWGIISW